MPWKLYLDSRKKTPGGSNTDFAIQLPYPINVSGKAFVDVVLLANSFYTIRDDENDKLYMTETIANGTLYARRLTIPAGRYTVDTLATAIKDAANTTVFPGQNSSGTNLPSQYTCSFSTLTGKITLTNTSANCSFGIWPGDYLKDHLSVWNGIAHIVMQLSTASDIQDSGQVTGFTGAAQINSAATKIEANDMAQVQPYHQLFIRSNLGGGSAESLGVNGESDVIRRICVGNTPTDGMIYDVHSQAHDHISINGKREFSSLWFQVVDHEGRIVDSRGAPLSFSVIFEDVDEI
jgi:hypothetical protein